MSVLRCWRSWCSVLALAGLAGCASPPSAPPPPPASEEPAAPAPLEVEAGQRRILIAGDQFYLDGVRLLIKGSFYAYHPVGRNPWEVHPPDHVLREHLRSLKAAGFNTIRWFQPTGHEIGLCGEEDVLVFQQLWIDANGDFADPGFRRENLERLREVVRDTRGHWNVLGYLVMNEPYLHTATSDEEIRATMKHLVEVRDMIKEEDPGAYVSLADWPQLLSLDHSMWDFICFNVYTWGTTPSDHGMGYRPFIEYVKRELAADRPLVILEYGCSVAPGNAPGYGGWSEEGQATESVGMLRDLLAGGAAGGVYTHFADQIWKTGSNAQRDSDPEEWFGMLELDLAGGEAMEGRWRPVYYAHRDFYEVVLLEPAPCATVRGRSRVLAHAPSAGMMHWRVDRGDWQELRNAAGAWWEAPLDTTALADGLHTIEVQAAVPGVNPVQRKVLFVAANHFPDTYAVEVSVVPSKASVAPGDPLAVTITVRRRDGTPVAGQEVNWLIHEHRGWALEADRVVTGPDGTARVTIDTANRLGLMTVSAGLTIEAGPYRRRFGDLCIVRVGTAR